MRALNRLDRKHRQLAKRGLSLAEAKSATNRRGSDEAAARRSRGEAARSGPDASAASPGSHEDGGGDNGGGVRDDDERDEAGEGAAWQRPPFCTVVTDLHSARPHW